MADDQGWPDPARPGFPADPSVSGPHVIKDSFARRRWVWWHLDDWKSLDEPLESTHPTMAGEDWVYIGPGVAPDGKPVP